MKTINEFFKTLFIGKSKNFIFWSLILVPLYTFVFLWMWPYIFGFKTSFWLFALRLSIAYQGAFWVVWGIKIVVGYVDNISNKFYDGVS